MLTELHGLSERWYQAWLEKDATTVERLMAEDYLYVGPNGLALDRQAILAIIGSPSYRLDHGTRTEVIVRALGHEAGIVRHRWQDAGSFEGTSFSMTIGVSWSGRNSLGLRWQRGRLPSPRIGTSRGGPCPPRQGPVAAVAVELVVLVGAEVTRIRSAKPRNVCLWKASRRRI
jgi:hypothetical protein